MGVRCGRGDCSEADGGAMVGSWMVVVVVAAVALPSRNAPSVGDGWNGPCVDKTNDGKVAAGLAEVLESPTKKASTPDARFVAGIFGGSAAVVVAKLPTVADGRVSEDAPEATGLMFGRPGSPSEGTGERFGKADAIEASFRLSVCVRARVYITLLLQPILRRARARSHEFVATSGFAPSPCGSQRDPKTMNRPCNAELSPF